MTSRSQHLALPVLGALFLAYAYASLMWSPGGQLWATIEITTLALAFIAGYHLPRPAVAWMVFCMFTAANHLPAIVTWAVGLDAVPHLPYGLFGNPNYLGCALTLGLAAALAYGFWWYLPIAAGGLWYTQSRGAIFAAGVALFLHFWRTHRGVALLLVVLAAWAVVLTSETRMGSMWVRVGIWQDTLNHLTPFGYGWGSFLTAYTAFPVKTNIGFQLAPHVYNDFLQLIFELGIGAIPLWLLIAVCFEGTDDAAKLIVLTFFALGLTYFPLHVPLVGHFFTLALSQLAASRILLRRSRWPSPVGV